MQDSVSYNDMNIDSNDVVGERGTLARGLRLLYLLAEFGRPVGLVELTAASGYMEPTVFRLARTLVLEFCSSIHACLAKFSRR